MEDRTDRPSDLPTCFIFLSQSTLADSTRSQIRNRERRLLEVYVELVEEVFVPDLLASVVQGNASPHDRRQPLP